MLRLSGESRVDPTDEQRVNGVGSDILYVWSVFFARPHY